MRNHNLTHREPLIVHSPTRMIGGATASSAYNAGLAWITPCKHSSFEARGSGRVADVHAQITYQMPSLCPSVPCPWAQRACTKRPSYQLLAVPCLAYHETCLSGRVLRTRDPDAFSARLAFGGYGEGLQRHFQQPVIKLTARTIMNTVGAIRLVSGGELSP